MRAPRSACRGASPVRESCVDRVLGKALWCCIAVLHICNTCWIQILCTLRRGCLPGLGIQGASCACSHAAVWVHGGSAPTCCSAG